MPIIYVSSTGGVIGNTDPTYSAARGAPTGDVLLVNPGTTFIGQREHLGSFTVRRAYMAFDTSAITLTPASATINLYFTAGSNASYYVQDSFAPDLTTDLAATDFDAYGPNGPYTSLIGITGDGWMSITLNPSALIALNTLSIFKVMILGAGDYTGTEPGTAEEQYDNVQFSTNIPYISYTEGVPGYIHKPCNYSYVNTINNITLTNIIAIYGVSNDPNA